MGFTINNATMNRSQLETLYTTCLAQMSQYRKGDRQEQSASCLAIVQCAIAKEPLALDYLLLVVKEIVERSAGSISTLESDDLVQEVSLRLLKRLSNSTSSIHFTSFSMFYQYITVTTLNVARLFGKKPASEPLDAVPESQHLRPKELSPEDLVEIRIIANEILTLLPDELEREVVRRRLLLGESPDEISQSLQGKHPELSKKKVYKVLEHAVRRLRKNPLLIRLRNEYFDQNDDKNV